MTLTELQALSPDELRVRVAELMGWRVECDGPPDYGMHGLHPGLHQPDDTPVELPPYHESLDSCREFEDAMTDEEHWHYRQHLRRITALDASTVYSSDKSRRAYLSATPLQRCQAYILTKQSQ